jgi:hypothetical protein
MLWWLWWLRLWWRCRWRWLRWRFRLNRGVVYSPYYYWGRLLLKGGKSPLKASFGQHEEPKQFDQTVWVLHVQFKLLQAAIKYRFLVFICFKQTIHFYQAFEVP